MPTETRLIVKRGLHKPRPYPKRDLAHATADKDKYRTELAARYNLGDVWIEQRQVTEWVKVDDA